MASCLPIRSPGSRTVSRLVASQRYASSQPQRLERIRHCQQTCRGFSRLSARNVASEQSSPVEGKEKIPEPLQYTAEKYPKLKRDPRFAQLTSDHVAHFKTILDSPSALISSLDDPSVSDDLDPYNTDWMRKYRGQSKLVLRPNTTKQVSKIVKYCNEQKLAIVPQGGNSGLVGGSVPVFDEIVLSLGRMNKIKNFDEVSGILVAEAGVILEVADNYLAERNYIFPLDLGAKGSCQLGGTVSTNAGGLRLLRYGSMHGNVLGLEAVLPDGTIVDDLSTLRKNNTGYDLKQLFIGGEGTLGIVTAISIICPQRGSAVNVAAFGVENYEKAQETFKEAKSRLSEIISAFEFMDAKSQWILKVAKDQKLPLDGEYPFYCLVETSGSNQEHDQEKLESFLEHVMSSELVADGVVAQDATQAASLWACREGITESLGHFGGVYKYDFSVPLPSLYSLVEATREHLQSAGLVSEDDSSHPVVGVVGFGHLGDSNLHLNVMVRTFDKKVEEALEPWLFERVKELKGSISAEHGLGLAKKDFVSYSRSDTMLRLMRQLKGVYDPNGIMNPYKYV